MSEETKKWFYSFEGSLLKIEWAGYIQPYLYFLS